MRLGRTVWHRLGAKFFCRIKIKQFFPYFKTLVEFTGFLFVFYKATNYNSARYFQGRLVFHTYIVYSQCYQWQLINWAFGVSAYGMRSFTESKSLLRAVKHKKLRCFLLGFNFYLVVHFLYRRFFLRWVNVTVLNLRWATSAWWAY